MADDIVASVTGGTSAERVTITIRPAASDQGLLRVRDAMQQVMDLLKIYEEAERAMASPGESFEWRLERATTNSPLTIVALAEPRDATKDITIHVRQVKSEVATGMRNLIEHKQPAWWMGPDAINAIRDVLVRNENGIGTTEIEAGAETFAINRTQAHAGLQAISGITPISAPMEIPDRIAWGEIQGLIVAVGTYHGKPALQLKTDQYKFVWCILSKWLVEQFGGDHTLDEIWNGKMIGAQGDLIYAKGGKLSRIEAEEIREIGESPLVDLAAVQGPNFTGGLDPVEYLRQLWEGSVA